MLQLTAADSTSSTRLLTLQQKASIWWLPCVLCMLPAGIAWTFLVSFCWFPETSSHTAFKQLLKMMQHLEGLGSNTWALLQQQQDLLTSQQQLQAAKLEQTLPQPEQQQQDVGSSQLSTSTHASQDSSRTHPTAASTSAQTSVPLPACAAAATDAGWQVPPDDVSIPVLDTVTTSPAQPARKPPVKQQGQEQQQQHRQPPELQQGFEGDACDEDMRNFFAARALLQDSLKAAAAERHLGWLCGRPLIVPSVLLPCSLSGSCCLRLRPKARQTAATADSRSHSTELPTSGCPAVPASTAGGGSGVCGLPPFLPSQQVRSLAIAQRHCSHVLWVLHKLLQDRFDRQSLLAVNSR